jgi:hypothetical protein
VKKFPGREGKCRIKERQEILKQQAIARDRLAEIDARRGPNGKTTEEK